MEEKKFDAYFDTKYAAERLYNEWLRHPKLIIACDFDDTVYDTHKKGHTFDMIIDTLKECNKLGFRIVCFTASKPERYEMIENHYKSLGIEIEGINLDLLPDHPFGKLRKIYANIFLDDRAGLFQAVTILNLVIERIKNQ